MWKSVKKWWKYMGAKVSSVFNEKADPKIQLEQAITEAQDQHRRLKEQAANVIANQKQTEMRLNAAMDELEKLNRNAQQAVIMADEAARGGDATKAAEFTTAAEAFANQLISKEAEIENLKTLSCSRPRPPTRPRRRSTRTPASSRRSSPRSRSC
jgi:phage shock protein A